MVPVGFFLCPFACKLDFVGLCMAKTKPKNTVPAEVEIDFYEGLRRIRASDEPISVQHVHLSLDKGTGGSLNWLENVTISANRKHRFSNHTIGFQTSTGQLKQIYIHSMLRVQMDGRIYKLKLKF